VSVSECCRHVPFILRYHKRMTGQTATFFAFFMLFVVIGDAFLEPGISVYLILVSLLLLKVGFMLDARRFPAFKGMQKTKTTACRRPREVGHIVSQDTEHDAETQKVLDVKHVGGRGPSGQSSPRAGVAHEGDQKARPSISSVSLAGNRHLGIITGSSSLQGYAVLSSGAFEEDLWFSFLDVEEKDHCSVRPGNAVSFIASESTDGQRRARAISFTFEGQLKRFDHQRNHGFIHHPCRLTGEAGIWFARGDLATEGPVLSVGATVRFEMYWGGNGKPRARRVEVGPVATPSQPFYGRVRICTLNYCFVVCEQVRGNVRLDKKEFNDEDWARMQVGVPVRFHLLPGCALPCAHQAQVALLTFRNACVKSYNASQRSGYVGCTGMGPEEEVWFSAACASKPADAQAEDSAFEQGALVQIDAFQKESGQLQAFRVSLEQ